MTATVSTIQPSLPVPVDDPALPHVATVVEDDTWDVTLDVTDQVDLVAFFAVIAEKLVLKESMRRLMFNHKNPSIRREALANLLQDGEVRAALTVTLDGGQAEALGILLDDASREPFPRCQWYEGGGGCNYFVVDKNEDEFCPMHVMEHLEARGRDGGYTPWGD